MKITTDQFCMPTSPESICWSAIDDDTYDGEGCPIGHGRTEAEAVADLMEQIENRDGDHAISTTYSA